MRKNNFKQQFRELKSRLKLINGREEARVVQFRESMCLISDFLEEVRKAVAAGSFADKFEEIYFFKFEKPEFYGLKIYQALLFALDNNRPCGTEETVRAYYLEELQFISRFFRQEAFLYQYFRAGFTELDEQLFLRGAVVQTIVLPEVPELDPAFSTNGDYLFAQFTAYELLQDHLLSEIRLLDGAVPVAVNVPSGKKWFDWKGEVINMVELGYGLFLSRQTNAGLQEIFDWLEESFGVEIGIPANRFREIKRRKRLSRTRFTEAIRDALIAYMDKEDVYDPDEE